MRIALGADHAGFELKEQLATLLRASGHDIVDVGTSSNEAVDYPTFAHAVARVVADGDCERGIMVDGAGIGSAMAANKVAGIRAAMAYDLSTARNSREHNNANVLTLGAGLIGPKLAEQIVLLWLGLECAEERHLRRAEMIEIPERGEAEQGPASAAIAPVGLVGQSGSPAGADPVSAEDLERIIMEVQRLTGACPMEGPCVGENPEVARRFLELGAGRFSSGAAAASIPQDIAGFIDHTILRADATAEEIDKLCAEAVEHGFAAVCVNPVWVRRAASALGGSRVAVCTVAGFPLGASAPESKGLEARRSIREGAREVDMVINVGALKSGHDDLVLRDIRAVVEACRDGSAICKVIIETALLTDEEKRLACRLARKAGAHFVKTSTGFASGGATALDVELMASEVAAAGMEVKASGGIRSYTDAREMIRAGASRIGASAGVAIMQEASELTVSS